MVGEGRGRAGEVRVCLLVECVFAHMKYVRLIVLASSNCAEQLLSYHLLDRRFYIYSNLHVQVT